MINVPVAYEWADLTFCPSCALRSTNMGAIVCGLGAAKTMDEAIANITLAQIERGLPVETPVAVMQPSIAECEACGATLMPEGAGTHE